MAINVDKALYQAPQGLWLCLQSQTLRLRSKIPSQSILAWVTLRLISKPQKETADTFDANLAEYMDDNDLDSLGRGFSRRF
jgi:hypothetical protein